MRIKQLPYVDWNSPGTMEPHRGEWEPEPPLEDIEIADDLPANVAEVVRTTPYRPSDPRLLPAQRFSDQPAARWHGKVLNAPTTPEETREHSRTVTFRLARSCSGWRRRPSAKEFYDSVRAQIPTRRQQGILETWAAEAEWEELLQAWTEYAYTFRELVTALHRAGLTRCHAARALNSWADDLNFDGPV
jgi:hypothetical protein